MALAPPPLIGRLYQGWLVIEILQLIGSSWLIHSQPAKFQSSIFSTSAKGSANQSSCNDLPLLFHLILLANLQHILLKLCLLFQSRFTSLHQFHGLYNLFSGIFLLLELFHFRQFQASISVLTQLLSNVITMAATLAIWIQWKVAEGRTNKEMKENGEGRSSRRKYGGKHAASARAESTFLMHESAMGRERKRRWDDGEEMRMAKKIS